MINKEGRRLGAEERERSVDWARGVVLKVRWEEWRGRSDGVRGSGFLDPDAVGLFQKLEMIAYVVCGMKGEGTSN